MQPYRKGARTRVPGGALAAMTRGRDFAGRNPQDVNRRTQRMARRKKRRGKARR